MEKNKKLRNIQPTQTNRGPRVDATHLDGDDDQHGTLSQPGAAIHPRNPRQSSGAQSAAASQAQASDAQANTSAGNPKTGLESDPESQPNEKGQEAESVKPASSDGAVNAKSETPGDTPQHASSQTGADVNNQHAVADKTVQQPPPAASSQRQSGVDSNNMTTTSNMVPPAAASASAHSTAQPATAGSVRSTYLVEYALLLIVIATLLGVAISLFNGIIDAIGSGPESGWRAQWAYTSSLAQISTAFVFGVALWFLGRRCNRVEYDAPAVKDHHWRRIFLGVFLIIVSLAALFATVILAYNAVSLLASIGVANVDGWEAAQNILTSLFSAVLLTGSAILYARDYRTGKMNPLVRKLHHYGLLVGVIVLALVFIVFPLRGERDAFIDRVTSGDIETLQREIDNYARDNDELPETLGDLNVDRDLENRLDSYEYEPDRTSYEICAEFRTDTTADGSSGSGNPLEDALSTSFSTMSSSDDDDPNVHTEGENCFEFDGPRTSFALPGGAGGFEGRHDEDVDIWGDESEEEWDEDEPESQ